MEKEGESLERSRAPEARLSRRSAATALLLVYALAAFLGIFHDRHEARVPTHAHAGCTTPDLESSDRPAHDETRCGLCHILTSDKIAPAADAVVSPTRLALIGAESRPEGLALVSSIPVVHHPRAPPAA
jgi:hypothetical protein